MAMFPSHRTTLPSFTFYPRPKVPELSNCPSLRTGIFPNDGPAAFSPNAFKIYPDMIKEFAIQPEVMATWNYFRELRNDFGVGRGRLISVYPSDWKNRVKKHAKEINQEIKAASILNTLHSYLYEGDHKFIRTSRASYTREKVWLENAEQSVQPNPFHVIVSTDNPRNHPAVLVAGIFDDTKPPYDVRTQLDVPRAADALADCCGLLLENCDDLRIVDPYFDATNRGFTNTFKAVLDRLNAGGRKLARLELHVAYPGIYNPGVQESHYSRAFERLISIANTLRVVFWQDLPEGFHARYLLTEFGGVKFDWGFDQGNSPTQLNEVVLLEHARFQEIRTRFTVPDPRPAGRCEIIEIKGQRNR